MAPSRSCHRSPLPCSCAHARTAEHRVAGSSAVSQHRPDHVAALYRDTPSGQAFLLSRYKQLYHDTLSSQTARLSRYKDCIVAQPPAASLSLMSLYKTVYRDIIHQLVPARALPAVSWPPLAVSWLVSWPSQPYRDRPCAPLGHPYAPAARPGPSPRPCLSSLVS